MLREPPAFSTQSCLVTLDKCLPPQQASASVSSKIWGGGTPTTQGRHHLVTCQTTSWDGIAVWSQADSDVSVLTARLGGRKV